jgi:hypothetical protein
MASIGKVDGAGPCESYLQRGPICRSYLLTLPEAIFDIDLEARFRPVLVSSKLVLESIDENYHPDDYTARVS